jgi:hypothetical protein
MRETEGSVYTYLSARRGNTRRKVLVAFLSLGFFFFPPPSSVRKRLSGQAWSEKGTTGESKGRMKALVGSGWGSKPSTNLQGKVQMLR